MDLCNTTLRSHDVFTDMLTKYVHPPRTNYNNLLYVRLALVEQTPLTLTKELYKQQANTAELAGDFKGELRLQLQYQL